ncbi:MAG: DUF6054 family protein [Anaeromicrobium sp.]|jgi:hypothetical protein|uniref:DUF6054 family protein n=1 Tax=Anaeromicrobium sp. TaxID=1929132 RepID=UPI0025DB9202|nr:DUF6054 family protein [Anaeromicrobium sp.]MCT4594474.1 DUF6054 family protein [Anaeromicrobium sp.]
MSKINLRVDITPEKAFHTIKRRQTADLVHEEFFDLGEGKSIGTLVFEKYYMRASNRAALIVIMDNFKGETEVRVISTGSSQGIIFNFDWGAAKNFTNSIKDILQDYIIEYTEY